MRFEFILYGSDAYREAVKLREHVLRAPLGRRFTEAELAAEKDHLHIVSYDDATLSATAVLVPEKNRYKMQRVAVLPEQQNRGIGSALMHFCEAHAKSQNINEIYVHARDSAVKFYSKHQYVSEGSMFDEDGIPHLKMVKRV